MVDSEKISFALHDFGVLLACTEEEEVEICVAEQDPQFVRTPGAYRLSDLADIDPILEDQSDAPAFIEEDGMPITDIDF